MTKLLHQIFYGHKKFDFSKETLDKLEASYMLTVERWETFVSDAKNALTRKTNKTSSSSCIPMVAHNMAGSSSMVAPPRVGIPMEIPTCGAPSAPSVIVPQSANTLFWSIFIGQYGYDEYLRIGTKYLNREMEEKQRIVTSLASQPKKLKTSNYKITNVAIEEILAEMSILQHDTFMTVVAYASFYDKTIWLVFDHSYLVFCPHGEDTNLDPSQTIVVVQQPEGARRKRLYGVMYPTTRERLDDITQSKLRLEHYQKPLKGMSAYKLPDLESMICKIPCLETADKRKKSELYDTIVNYLAIPYQK
jgi:hypothetical protein